MSFKICTIGCGLHSSLYHGPTYKKYAELNEDVKFAACCDISEERACDYKRKFGFERHYTDMVKMLDTERPDAVCLIAPETLTAELASIVLGMGYPLILEKPPGRTRKEVSELAEMAERAKVPNRVAFNRRFAPLSRELKRLLDENFKPSDIHNISCEMFRVERREPDFMATAIHAIDFVRFVAGSDYSSIRFGFQELPLLGKNVANIFMNCTFKSGAAACFNISPVSGVSIERTTVNAYNNTFFLSTPMYSDYDFPGRLIHLQGNKVKLDITGHDIKDGDGMFEHMGIYYENATFFDALRKGEKPGCDLAEAVQSVEVAECIRNRTRDYRADQIYT